MIHRHRNHLNCTFSLGAVGMVPVGLAALALLACGCAWTDARGTHHLIVGLGFGVITTTNRAGIEVVESHVLGGEFGAEGAGVGFMRHHRVVVDPAQASNSVVAVKSTPFGVSIKNFDPYAVNTNKSTVNKLEGK